MRKQPAAFVPAEPIQKAIREHLDTGLGPSFVQNMHLDVQIAPMTSMAELIWPQMSQATGTQRLGVLLRQKHITFDLADRILVALDRVELWWSDPVLAEFYPIASVARPSRWSKQHVSARVLPSHPNPVSVRPESDVA